MPSNGILNILFIGDIIGRPGRRAVTELLPGIKGEYGIGFTVANCENSAGGFGVTEKIVGELTELGIDALTSGNHIWDRRDVAEELDSFTNVLRPFNYPPGLPGRGYGVFEAAGGMRVAVINLQGRVFMRPIDCPFRAADELLKTVDEKIVLVDMHAEATSEKVAMGWHLDGRVSAVIGTHTHVQTSDERVLPGGTGYITDVGMTGPHDSVIGIDKQAIIKRFLTEVPNRFEVGKEDVKLSGLVVAVDTATGRAIGVERLHRSLDRGGD
jgi:metallophosphoesterase (TIGR00282 family)